MDSTRYTISTPAPGRFSAPAMSSALLSMTIFSTELSSKRPELIDVSPLPMVISFTPAVLPKAPSPTEVTELGIAKVLGRSHT